MKQLKRGYLHCKQCKAEMHLETLEAAEESGRTEPALLCAGCGATVPWADIADTICRCGATSVLRDFALSAPEHGLRLYLTELSSIAMFHRDGRGLIPREACTACTDCFVCKEPLTQACAWDEIPLEGLQKNKGITQQFVYMHPGCFPAYEAWLEVYLARMEERVEEHDTEAEHREHLLSSALCLNCERPLSLLERFTGRTRHIVCPVKRRATSTPASATKKSGKNSAKRAK
jgi:hypothetical protein